MLKFAVVPTTGRECLRRCVQAISPQIDHLIVVAHNWVPPEQMFNPQTVTVIPYKASLPNISTMWNLGLDTAEALAAGEEHYVAVLNDDAIVPADWFERLHSAMEDSGASAGSVARVRGLDAPILHKEQVAINWKMRMAGYAFMLNGQHEVRANEILRWYYTDDYIDFIARERGGTLVIPEPQIIHLYPTQSTKGALLKQAKKDQHTFFQIWRTLP